MSDEQSERPVVQYSFEKGVYYAGEIPGESTRSVGLSPSDSEITEGNDERSTCPGCGDVTLESDDKQGAFKCVKCGYWRLMGGSRTL